MTAVYLNDDLHERLTEALAAIEPCSFAGRATCDQVAIVLGEVGDIWPETILKSEAQCRTVFPCVSRGTA